MHNLTENKLHFNGYLQDVISKCLAAMCDAL